MAESHELEDRRATNIRNPTRQEQTHQDTERPATVILTDFVSGVRENFSKLWSGCGNSVEVEIIDVRSEQETPKPYLSPLSSYLKLMYHIGATRYNGKADSSGTGWKLLHLARYFLFCALSFYFCLRSIKYDGLKFLGNEEQLDKFIGLMSTTIGSFAKMYFLHFITFNLDRMEAILTLLEVNEPNGDFKSHRSFVIRFQGKATGWGLGIASIILALADVFFFFYQFDGWSFEEFFRVHSYFVLGDVTWTPATFANGTVELWHTISDAPYTHTYTLLGTCGGLINFAGLLNQLMLLDSLLLVSISLSWHASNLVETLLDENTNLEVKWNKYQKMKAISNGVNENLGLNVPLCHVSNILLVSYFVLYGFKRLKYVSIFIIAVQVVKIAFTYYMASRTSDKNNHIRQWIKKVCMEHETIIVAGQRLDKFVLFDDITTDAIGLGRNESFVNEGFLVKIVGYVSAIFLLLAGEHARECKAESSK